MGDERNYGRSGYQSRDRGQDRPGSERYDRDDDRGFIDRAGDEVRSWFGDDDAERRREADARRWEQERGQHHSRDDHRGDFGTGGGWGNQRGDSWSRERPGVRDDDRSSMGSRYSGDHAGGGGADIWGGSGFGGQYDRGRRFDRIDAGSTGTHGAHPMSSPVGRAYGSGYGVDSSGNYGSSARYAAQRQGSSSGADDHHDRSYSEWRKRQMESLDRDYDEYRREHQSKFESEFGGWRERRQGQRQSLGKVAEHMEVVGNDGQHVGTVDKVRGDRIILTKSDDDANGRHHSIPCSWIDGVDDKVTINKSASDAQKAWRDEENSRALFEREDQGSDGPHILDRSFSGTYGDR